MRKIHFSNPFNSYAIFFQAEFLWDRTHLFDKDVVTVILEDCKEAAVATVEEVTNKPKTKYRPVVSFPILQRKKLENFLKVREFSQ